MNKVIVPAVAVVLSLVQVAWPAPARKPGDRTDSLDQKLLGSWKGDIGCAGTYHFRSDGTYELTGYGPAPVNSAGTWKLRGDTLPATLVLTCTDSEVPEEVGVATEVKLVRLESDSLAIMHGNESTDRYSRRKK